MHTTQIRIIGSSGKTVEIKNTNVSKELYWLILLKLCIPLLTYHTKTNANKSKYYFKYDNLGAILKNTKLLQLFNSLYSTPPNRYTHEQSSNIMENDEIGYYNLLCDKLIVELIYKYFNDRISYSQIIIHSIGKKHIYPCFNTLTVIDTAIHNNVYDSIYHSEVPYVIDNLFCYLYSNNLI